MQVQVLKYSATTQDDGTFRLDAEHYQEKYLNNQQRLIKFRSTRLLDMVAKPVITGHTPSMKIESYYGGNIGFANLGDTIPIFCKFRVIVLCSVHGAIGEGSSSGSSTSCHTARREADADIF